MYRVRLRCHVQRSRDVHIWRLSAMPAGASSSGGFAARLCRFYPKGLKNPTAYSISICNAPFITVINSFQPRNSRILTNLQKSSRISTFASVTSFPLLREVTVGRRSLGLQILIFRTSGFQIQMNCKGSSIRLTAGILSRRDTSRPYKLHHHSCRGIV